MKNGKRPGLRVAALIASVAVLAGAVPVSPPPPPANLEARPVEETYFGTAVVDRFRFVESKDPATLGWMRAQSAYTRALFDSIVPRAEFFKRLSELGAAFGMVDTVQTGGSRIFYRERQPGSEVFDLVVKEGGKSRALVDTAALIKAAGGVPHAIDYYQTSADGRRVAVGISAGGSEASSVTVLDVDSGRTIAGPIDRAQFGSPSWLDDAAGVFFLRLQELRAGAPASDKYLNSAAWFWDLKALPTAIVGASTGRGPVTEAVKFPLVSVVRDSGHVLLTVLNGVQNEVEVWTGAAVDARRGAAHWRKLVATADDVTGIDAHGDTIYLLTHKEAPTFKVLSLPFDATLAAARTVIPARPERVIESIHVAADGLYVAARQGLDGKVLRVDSQGRVRELALPFTGSVEELSTDARRPGAIVALVGWVHPPTHYRYDPASGGFTDLKLDSGPRFDPARYQVVLLDALARDGTRVPLSVITAAGPVQARPLLLDAYGSYGISSLPFFRPRIPALVDAGGTYAQCHVRGGGELGEAWRLGGKDANKPNTWRDFIACAETLIEKGYTTRALLTIQGTSAGGIAVGRAATERPELFTGAVGRVADLNVLRSETMSSGPANVPEFGTFKDPQGFNNLLMMDAYQHVRDDGHYPAFLLTTGLNDPRVEPWEPVKMAARLMEMPGHQPVLLRVEEAAGHGFGTTKSTRDAEDADIAAFVFWRAGVPAWQPRH
jgi:prolyl oligopeptidase